MRLVSEDLLTETGVIPYLVERGLLDMSRVVAGEVRVVDASRRNRNFRVRCADGPSFLLKQGLTRDGAGSVAREARAYELLGLMGDGGPDDGAFPYAPRAWAYDAEGDVLVTELLTGTEDMRARRLRGGRPAKGLARGLGRALATLHALVPRTVSAAHAHRLLGAGEPGVLAVHRPGVSLLRDFSSACVDLIRMIQSESAVVEALTRMEREWRTDTLIHHDLRWDNILVPAVRPSAGRRVMLIDWETAALGDGAWDLGAVFGEYLGDWLGSVPTAGGQRPERFLDLASCPLEWVQPAIRAFWLAYRQAAGLSPGGERAAVVRAARCCGLKLIQSGLEQAQRSSLWSVASVCFLQVGANIMTRPEQAVTTLLGLDGPA